MKSSNTSSTTSRSFRFFGILSVLALGSLAGCVMDTEANDFDAESEDIDSVSAALTVEICNGIDDDGDFLIDEDAANTQNGAGCGSSRSVSAGHAYLTVQSETDRATARAVCKARGFDLARVDSAAENNHLTAQLVSPQRAWIGLNDIATEGTWRWADGGQLGAYTSWDPGQPDNAGGNEDCVFMYHTSGLWADLSCLTANRAFCELFDQVTWTNLTGVNVDVSSLTKTSTGTSWDAGASSTQSIPVGSNGFVEFSTNEVDKGKAVGLSIGDANRGLAEIDFALVMKNDGKLAIYENNSLNDDLGTYVAGDVFRVEVLNGVVRYLRNGALMQSHTAAVTGPLLVDTSLQTQGATIVDVRSRTCSAGDTNCMDPGVWQDASGVLAKGNVVQAYGWTKKAATIATMTGNGYVELATPSIDADTASHWQKVAGLRPTTLASDSWGNNIAYGVRFEYINGSPMATARVKGALAGCNAGTVNQIGYAAGDVFRVEMSGNSVYYKKNGTTYCTHTITATEPQPSAVYVLQTNLANVVAPSSFTNLAIVDLP